MTILITGGAGYIGSHMAWALLDQGMKFTILDNLSTGSRALIPPTADFVEGDVSDTPLVKHIIADRNIRSIVHFAAKAVVPESVRDPLLYYDANTVKTTSLLKSAIDSGVEHFIFSSTAAVYGDGHREPVDEDSTTLPVSPYGASKLMSERIIKDCAEAYQIKYAILRYFNVAGADPQGRTGQSTPDATHLIKVAAEVALGKRQELKVFGTDYPTRDGSCVRDFIHVSDLADAHVKALEHLRRGGENLLLNCGYGCGFSVLEVVAAIERATSKPLNVKLGERRKGDPAEVVATGVRVRDILGWVPEYASLEAIVSHALAWEKLRL